jgi:hypothetical protein
VGAYKFSELLEKVPLEKVIKFFYTLCERRTSVIDELSRKEGRMVKIVRVMDFEGGSVFGKSSKAYSQFDKQYLGAVLKGTSIETIQLLFVINFPDTFKKVFDMLVKPFLPPRLFARFRFLDQSYLQDKKYLEDVGMSLSKQLVAKNSAHSESGAGPTGEADAREGTNQAIPAGMFMERIVEVTAGQKVSWEFTMGKDNDSSRGGYFSKLASKFSGSEVMFNVSGMWTDKMLHEIPKIPAKVRSAGAESGDAAEFWFDGKQIQYSASKGVNVVAIDLQTRAVSWSKVYDPSSSQGNDEFVPDIASLPIHSAILLAVKGTGAEDLSDDSWDTINNRLGGLIKQGHWQKGYALIATRWGDCVAEARNPEAVIEGQVPTLETAVHLQDTKEVSIETGEEKGSVQVSRDGMVILSWSNAHAYVANKALARYKITVE